MEIYFQLSERELIKAIRKMLENGDLELALETAIAAEKRYPSNSTITELKVAAADRLRNMAQFFDPFKFTVYTQIAEREHPGMPEN